MALLSGIPAPRLGRSETSVPHAFSIRYRLTAGGVQRSVVAVTRGLPELLDSAELERMLAHEPVHRYLKNDDAALLTAANSVTILTFAFGALVSAIVALYAWLTGLLGRITT
nr:M48 family metalloprotease [Thermomicrobium sp. CFH 73360]